MIKKSENKMIGRKIDKSELSINNVWICLHCQRFDISINKPQDCVCHNPKFVIDTTKKVG